jgi:hypothetical protein
VHRISSNMRCTAYSREWAKIADLQLDALNAAGCETIFMDQGITAKQQYPSCFLQEMRA